MVEGLFPLFSFQGLWKDKFYVIVGVFSTQKESFFLAKGMGCAMSSHQGVLELFSIEGNYRTELDDDDDYK
jgi:hypothetical protein